MTTFEPTFETLLILERIQNGDNLAIKDLWEHALPEVPFDPTRRLEDVGKDLADVFDAYTTKRDAEEAEKAAQAKAAQPTADATAESVEMITKAIGIITDILSSPRKRR